MFTRVFRRSRNRRTLRRVAPLGVALALVAAPLAFLPGVAEAGPNSSLDGSPFNGTNGVLDAHVSIGAHDDVGLPDTFAGGVKEDTDCPPIDGGGAPKGSDILTGWVGTANGTVSGVTHNFLYLGWSRPADEGTFTIDFELNSGAVSCPGGSPFIKRVAGSDLLFEYEFKGGSTIGVSVRTWTANGNWSDPAVLPATKAEAAISTDQLFGELVVDMTAAGFFQAGVCKNFSSSTIKSRASSSSFENQIKDLILPFPIEVTNCGSLTVTKTVVGGGANDSFQFTVDCGTFDLNGVGTAGDDLSFSLANGGSRKIDDIPLGKICGATETSPGATSWSTTYKIGSGSSQTGLAASGIEIALGNKTVAFTNTRLLGDLVVTKAADATGTFLFNIDCSDNSFDRTGVSAAPGSPYRLPGIPTGTTCTVTEQANPLFSSDVSPVGGAVTIAQGDNTVAFTNTRLRGNLVITKATDVAGTFLFDIDCSDNTFDRTGVPASPANPYRLEGIPTGTVCTVAEQNNPLFASVSVPSNGTRTIALGDNTVAFTNTRLRGDLVITKAADASGTFLFDIDCSDNNFDRTGVAASPGTPYRLEDIPTTTTCTVTEQNNPLFSSVVVPANGTVTIATGDNTVAFTNTRLTGALVITKAADVSGSFLFDINCSNDAFDRTGVAASPGTPYRLGGIPTGTSCTVTEQGNPLFSSVVLPSDGTVDIALGDNTVAFTNTRLRGSLVITKAADQAGTFLFDINCSDNAYDRTGVTASPGLPYTLEGIPTTTTCTATEQSNPLFTSTVVPANGTVEIGTGVNTVAFTNTAKPNGISIDKTVNGVDTSEEEPLVVEAGTTLDYVVVITNSGQVPLSIAELSDSLEADLAESCEPDVVETMLDPGDTITCSYSMTAADPGGNSIIHNTASVEGIDIFERPAGPDDDETFVHVLDPAIHLEKAGPARAHVGDTITYALTVTNPGNTPLAITDWVDDQCDAEPVLKSKEGEDSLLDPGEAWVYECSRVILAGDPDQLVNTATVTGEDQLEKEVDDTDDAVTEILRPAIAVAKSGPGSVHVGDSVIYTLIVTNPGNTPLADVNVVDPKCDGAPVRENSDSDGLLSPGEAWTYHCTHIATAADGQSILNTATVKGTDPLGRTVDNDGNHTTAVLHPGISIVKTANPTSVAVSGPVTYIYVVTNTGDTTLFEVLVTDDILGAIGRIPELAPGESVTLAKTVDVDAGTPPTNIGTAVGTDVLGQTVTASDDATITVVLGAVEVAPQELPRTGAPLGAQTRAALAMIQVGLVLTLAGRRRRMVRRAD